MSIRIAIALLALAAAAPAAAQPAPPSIVASPDVYRVVAENAQYRVIEVTWKPGQRDAMHSHPTAGVYYLTDCRLRHVGADGAQVEVQPKAGHARVQGPIPGHTMENIGTADCRLIMFEPR